MIHPPINYGEWIVPQYPSYGQEIVISCPLEGNPSALYQWFYDMETDTCSKSKNRSAIYPNNHLNITLLNNNQTLYFRKFNEDHNGCYICSAKNFLGIKTYSDFQSLEVDSKYLYVCDLACKTQAYLHKLHTFSKWYYTWSVLMIFMFYKLYSLSY